MRHCSVCGRTGHDARRHARANPMPRHDSTGEYELWTGRTDHGHPEPAMLQHHGTYRTLAAARKVARSVENGSPMLGVATWIRRRSQPLGEWIDRPRPLSKQGSRRAKAPARPAPTRRNPDTLAAARRASRAFHGAGAGDVVRLTERERRLPRYVVPLGTMPEITYTPARGARAGWNWRHVAGDRGTGRPRSRRRPLLVADPTTGRAAVIPQGSPMRFNRRKGLVG